MWLAFIVLEDTIQAADEEKTSEVLSVMDPARYNTDLYY